jgi:hypothetical protein
MQNPFAPLVAVAQRGTRFTASSPATTPCDASFEKTLQDASQNAAQPPQPTETKELKTPSLIIPHTPTRCVTRAPDLPREPFETDPQPREHLKKLWPPMNTDKRRLKTKFLSAFTRVHRRLKIGFFAASARARPFRHLPGASSYNCKLGVQPPKLNHDYARVF